MLRCGRCGDTGGRNRQWSNITLHGISPVRPSVSPKGSRPFRNSGPVGAFPGTEDMFERTELKRPVRVCSNAVGVGGSQRQSGFYQRGAVVLNVFIALVMQRSQEDFDRKS